MKLYKNVDIVDLESILQEGILSLDESKNNNWGEHKRANNRTDVVYLFEPLSKYNSFCNYGVALLEVESPDNTMENPIAENDANKGKYIEYITERVEPNLINTIYIPKIFKGKFFVSENVEKMITWVDMRANWYGERGKEICTDKVLKRFSETAKFEDTTFFNFFRGITERNTMIDLCDIQYLIGDC